jgi:hypothetical protein
MIFQFPSLETFRLAVTSAQVPPEIIAAPAEVAFDPEGRPSVRSAAGIPPRPMQNALRKLGVKQAKEHYSETVLSVDCWPQVLPVSKQPGVPEITSNTPVLFEMPASEMATIVTEMLRLGNDRQSFRTIAPAAGEPGRVSAGSSEPGRVSAGSSEPGRVSAGRSERILLKVIGPPYYTLLRAIDKTTQQGANVVAYLERAPRVWVEIGHEHPLAGQMRPANKQVLLLRPERDWTVVEDAPFQDVYEVLDFQLPAAAVEWQASQLKGKLSVPLRLVGGNAADVAEMWVLTEDAVDQLDALVRDADERLMSRLSFAVAKGRAPSREGGEPGVTIVLRTRPSKLSPPVLSLAKAHGFKPYWKLPNLFVPVGKRLMPTLRRDAVRKLLADDPAQVVWLMPGPDGKFTPEVLPDDAFRPLEDWIDYVINHEHEPLAAWVQATRFDFDSFICREETDRPKGPPSDKAKRPKKGDRGDELGDDEGIPLKPMKGDRRKPAASDEATYAVPTEVVAPSEVKLRLRELEQDFVKLEGPLDSPERQALWPQLAHYNSLDGRELEAAICWTNAFWELPEVPVEGAWAWLHSEDRKAKRIPTGEEFDAALANKQPSPNEMRAFVARIVHACKLTPIPETFVKRQSRIREYLERHEGSLGVRTVWLAWWHLARVGEKADVLALARVRDRLLQRLLAEGLNKERDLPYFLRTAGEQNSDRLRMVRDRARKVHKLVQDWHAGEDVKVNRPFIDLMFAFGLAKLGEVTAARDLITSAKARLLESVAAKSKPDPANEFLFNAFAWRIENALQGKPHTGPLTPEMMARLETIDADRGNSLGWRYVVDRIREVSWIIEPQERIRADARWQKHADELKRTLAELANSNDPKRLVEGYKQLWRSHHSADNRLVILAHLIPLAPRAGEEFTTGLLRLVPETVDAAAKATGPREHLATLADSQKKLFERSLFLAGHFDRPELVLALFAKFLAFLRGQSEEERYSTVGELARECLRSLRKMGLKDEIDLFLKKCTELVIQDRNTTQLRTQAGNRWPDVLGSLLAIAEGWLYFGGTDQAKPLLAIAREAIVGNGQVSKEKKIGHLAITKVIRAYISALGQGPVEEALQRIEELFPKLEKLPNTFTTSQYYSLLHLQIVEEVIRSLISDNIALGDQARRWLDDDEYLVRRRIHADMKRLLAQSGL